MSRALGRAGAVVLSAAAMFALLLGLAALALGTPERAAGYLAATLLAAVTAGALMRREMRERRAEESRLPVELRPERRVPRRPITFPLLESALVFAAWYAIAAVVDRAVTGETTFFTLAVIAPFAAFMLTAITVAGRHMAFRLTAEEAESEAEGARDSGR